MRAIKQVKEREIHLIFFFSHHRLHRNLFSLQFKLRSEQRYRISHCVSFNFRIMLFFHSFISFFLIQYHFSSFAFMPVVVCWNKSASIWSKSNKWIFSSVFAFVYFYFACVCLHEFSFRFSSFWNSILCNPKREREREAKW